MEQKKKSGHYLFNIVLNRKLILNVACLASMYFKSSLYNFLYFLFSFSFSFFFFFSINSFPYYSLQSTAKIVKCLRSEVLDSRYDVISRRLKIWGSVK